MTEFFAMGGYAFYVWGSFGATAVIIVAEVLAVRARRRAAADLARATAPDSLSAATQGVL
jgi:heme exporter protein D